MKHFSDSRELEHLQIDFSIMAWKHLQFMLCCFALPFVMEYVKPIYQIILIVGVVQLAYLFRR